MLGTDRQKKKDIGMIPLNIRSLVSAPLEALCSLLLAAMRDGRLRLICREEVHATGRLKRFKDYL